MITHDTNAFARVYLTSAFHLPVRLTSITQATNDTVAGVVQMYYGSEWHYVCPDFFDNLEAAVVCRKLGYGNYRALPRGALGRIYFNSYATVTGLNCTGNEASLTRCPFQVAACPGSQTNYASVLCSKTSIPQGNETASLAGCLLLAIL